MMTRGEMSYFYVRNMNFVALFKINENGEPIATVIPSKNLVATFNESIFIQYFTLI